MRRLRPGLTTTTTKKEFSLDSNDSGFICADVSNVGGYKGNA